LIDLQNATTTVSKEIRDLHPIEKFFKLKKEIDDIEKDLIFAKNNVFPFLYLE